MSKFAIIIAPALIALVVPQTPAYAHPGRTAADGGHYCWTNCSYWGEVYGARHYHSGYSAPIDTGRVRGILQSIGATYDDFNYFFDSEVPLVVETEFKRVFGRKPTGLESDYWKIRARDDKTNKNSLRAAMGWHKSHGSTGPANLLKNAMVAGEQITDLVPRLNSIFKSVYDRTPTLSEHGYWLSRIPEKKDEQALRDAMAFHKLSGISH